MKQKGKSARSWETERHYALVSCKGEICSEKRGGDRHSETDQWKEDLDNSSPHTKRTIKLEIAEQKHAKRTSEARKRDKRKPNALIYTRREERAGSAK